MEAGVIDVLGKSIEPVARPRSPDGDIVQGAYHAGHARYLPDVRERNWIRFAKPSERHLHRVTTVLAHSSRARSKSPLYAPTSLALHQTLHFAHIDAIEVAKNGMLEAGCGSAEFESAPVVAIND
jgi:hypothetical protein